MPFFLPIPVVGTTDDVGGVLGGDEDVITGSDVSEAADESSLGERVTTTGVETGGVTAALALASDDESAPEPVPSKSVGVLFDTGFTGHPNGIASVTTTGSSPPAESGPDGGGGEINISALSTDV